MIDIAINRFHQKFNHDSIDYEDDHYLIQTGGVFLGIQTSNNNKLVNYIISEYSTKGESFVNDLRGSFSIYLFDKANNKHLIYTNHIGDKRIFYAHTDKKLIVSSSIKKITKILQDENMQYSIDRNAIYYMLTFGYLFNDSTLIKDIKRLKPGHYIRFTHERMEVVQYFKLSNAPNIRLSERGAIEQLDELFRNSIQLEFEKDLDYGFKHLCSLSGGLDSRMTTWVAHELGYSNITNLTFSQTGYLDMTIPRQMTNDLKHEWIFKPLDSGLFMCEIEDITQLIEGTTSYLPISHGKSAIDDIDFNAFGLLHTGQLGDVTIGSYMSKNDYGIPRFTKASSNRFIHKLPGQDLEGYENLELFLYMNRGFNYILTGNVPIQQHTEAISPFLDIDFLNFCMSIPLKYRINHHLYKKWILHKYPEAAKYIWERLGSRITARTISIRRKSVAYSKLPAFVLKGIRLHMGLSKRNKLEGVKSMNPFQYWYDTKVDISTYIEDYFKDNIDLVSDPEIKRDLELLFIKGSINEKAQVLTLLASINLFLT